MATSLKGEQPASGSPVGHDLPVWEPVVQEPISPLAHMSLLIYRWAILKPHITSIWERIALMASIYLYQSYLFGKKMVKIEDTRSFSNRSRLLSGLLLRSHTGQTRKLMST